MIVTIFIILASVIVSYAPAKPGDSRLATIKQSPQWRDGQFINTLPHHNEPIWRIVTENLWSNAAHRTPSASMSVVKPDSRELRKKQDDELHVTWFGHSSVLIEIDGYKILTDPVWSERASPFSFIGPKRFFAPPLSLDELPELDAVVISHDHFDHLDEKTVRALKDRAPLFAVPLGVGAHLESWGVEAQKIEERDWWGEITIGHLTLTATPARHFSGRSLATVYLNETLWSGWAIAGNKHRVYYSGDTAMFPGFKEIGEKLGPFDLTMIEAGGYNALWRDSHIGPEQAMEAHKMVKGKLFMPVHWATFDLAHHNWTEPAERVVAAAQSQSVSFVIPRPGESFNADSPPGLTQWWPTLPWQTAQQAPVISTGLTPPAELAEATQLSQATQD